MIKALQKNYPRQFWIEQSYSTRANVKQWPFFQGGTPTEAFNGKNAFGKQKKRLFSNITLDFEGHEKFLFCISGLTISTCCLP